MLSDRELLSAVQEAADDYTVYGELGRQGDSLAALLARERASSRLVVLMVQAGTGPGGEIELSVEVRDKLDARVPDGGTKCPACGAMLRPWVRFCTRCGHDVTGKGAVTPEEREELRAAVLAAVEGEFEFLGEMRRSEGGGDVFFARERSSGRIAALRLNRSATDGEFELGETNIMRKAPVANPARPPKAPLVSVTQLLRKLDPDEPFPGASSMAPAQPASNSAYAPNAPYAPVPPQRTSDQVPDTPAAPTRLPMSPRTMLLAAAGVVAVIAILAILVLQ